MLLGEEGLFWAGTPQGAHDGEEKVVFLEKHSLTPRTG